MKYTIALKQNGTAAVGVWGGVATEGLVIWSDLLIPSALSQSLTGGRLKWTHGQYMEQKCASDQDKRHHLYANVLWGFHRGAEVCRSFRKIQGP